MSAIASTIDFTSALATLNAAAQAQAAQIASYQQTIAQQAAQLIAAKANQPIAPGTDLGPVLASAKPGQTIRVQADSTYPLTGAPTPAAGVSVVGDNTSIVLTPVPGGSTGIAVKNPDCMFSGLKFSAAPGLEPYTVVALHIWASGTRVNDCYFDASLKVGIQTDVGADGTSVVDCNFGITGAQGIYATADHLRVFNCTFAGSVGEHPFRAELNATTGHRPQNLIFVDCSFTNHNALGKECFTAREAIDVVCIHCTFDGWTRFGQGYVDTIVHCDQVLLRDCTWKTLRPGGALSQFERNCSALVDHCILPASATDPAFSVNPGTVVTASANTMLVPIGMNPKPLAVPAVGGTFNEVGTIRKAA